MAPERLYLNPDLEMPEQVAKCRVFYGVLNKRVSDEAVEYIRKDIADAELSRLRVERDKLKACNDAMGKPMRLLREVKNMWAENESAVARETAKELSRLREAAEEALALITGDLVGGAIRVERKLRAALTSTQPEKNPDTVSTPEPERCDLKWVAEMLTAVQHDLITYGDPKNNIGVLKLVIDHIQPPAEGER
jgi:hypothetical protein